jgi:hypothetical protein
MDRRGFLSKIKSFFGPGRPKEIAFFGVQTVINAYAKDNLRAELHKVISASSQDQTPADKKAFYKKITSILLECQPMFEYGYWDYLTDPDEAEGEFNDWVSDIEGSMSTEEEETADTVDNVHRISSDKYYVVATLAFLFEASDALEPLYTLMDEIPEEKYFTRETFSKLLNVLDYIDYEYSYGDAAYIMPGNEKDGFSSEDMHTEGWAYLKSLSA